MMVEAVVLLLLLLALKSLSSSGCVLPEYPRTSQPQKTVGPGSFKIGEKCIRCLKERTPFFYSTVFPPITPFKRAVFLSVRAASLARRSFSCCSAARAFPFPENEPAAEIGFFSPSRSPRANACARVRVCVYTRLSAICTGSGVLLADTLAHLVGAIRENITISRAQVRHAGGMSWPPPRS